MVHMQDTLCPKELRAQRSWHLQRSPPAQSEDLPPEVWLPTLSEDERLLYAARSGVLLEEPLVVGESRQPHFWWQILRLRWR